VAASIGLGWADTYVLFGVVGQGEAGAYQATYRVATSLSYLYIPLGSAVVSAINAGRSGQVRRLGYLGGSAVLLAGFACVPVLVFLQRRVWGSGYELPTSVTLLLIASSLMAGVSYISGLVLAARGRRAVMLWANVAAVLLLLGLSWLLIPALGTLGAAVSSLVAYSASAIVQLGFARRHAAGSASAGQQIPDPHCM
jgi:PST family polysaccharide transporter